MALRVRGLQRGELDGFLTCFQAAFGVDDQSLAVVRNSLVNDPYFQPERVRVGLVDGMVASHAVILHRAVYVGSQVVTVAGITAVATHPYFQHRGFGTRVMQDAMRLVRQRGYELAMLTTRVPGFFARLGFREVPKVDGYQCPATALAKVSIPEPCAIQKLDYEHHWPALAAIYHQYSQARTGMQVRDLRCWESWPRRGTFPHGFSSHLDACGLVGVVEGQNVAYLAAHIPVEPRQLLVTDLAHLPGHERAALTLLREAAAQFLQSGSGRTVLHMGGEAPLLKLLEQQRVPLQVEIGPGLMVLIPNEGWVRAAGFESNEEAIDRLFRSPVPILWHRDGY
jgi:predicted N-acetyltransferase YhbS